MPKISVEVNLNQIEQIMDRLKSRDRLALLRRLERKTWNDRFWSLVAQIDKRRKKYPVSRGELLKLTKQARQERYAAGRS